MNEELQKIYQTTIEMDKVFENIRDNLPTIITEIKTQQNLELLRNDAKQITKQFIKCLESLKTTQELLKTILKNTLEETT